MHLSTLTLGDVTREGHAFRAELRSRAGALDVERGRLYTPRCSADLGDERCGVALDAPDRRARGAVVAAEAASLVVSGIGLEAARLAGGRLEMTSGICAGWSVEIAAASGVAAGLRLSLWQKTPEVPAAGDTVVVTIGCDKSFATCRDRFGNAANFRGFPHMPGIDRIVSVPVAGEGGHDGSVVR